MSLHEMADKMAEVRKWKERTRARRLRCALGFHDFTANYPEVRVVVSMCYGTARRMTCVRDACGAHTWDTSELVPEVR